MWQCRAMLYTGLLQERRLPWIPPSLEEVKSLSPVHFLSFQPKEVYSSTEVEINLAISVEPNKALLQTQISLFSSSLESNRNAFRALTLDPLVEPN